MRELRYVGPGVEPDRVIVELVDGSEQFSLPVAAVVHHSTQTDLLGAPAPTVVDEPSAPASAAPPAAEAKAEPMTTTAPAAPAAPAALASSAAVVPTATLSPRDIQVRVRAGESPEQLAAQSGDDLARIMRFAGPVLAERVRITDEARRGRARRNNADAQTTVFGVAVEERFGQHGVDLAAVRWDAYRRGDGQWIVTATWPESSESDGERQADWSFNLTTRTVTPLDDHAVELLSDRPIRPATAAGEANRPTLTVAPPLADGVVPFPAHPDAYTGPLPRDDVFDQEAFGADGDDLRTATSPVPAALPKAAPKPVRAVPSPAPAPRVEAAPEPETAAAELPLDLPLPTVEEADGAVTAEPEEDDGDEPAAKVTNLGVAHRGSGSRANKPKMPSWDDILMGVRRKTD